MIDYDEAGDLKDEIERLRAKVEELESRDITEDIEAYNKDIGVYEITTEQINAAVDYIRSLYSSDDQRYGLGIIEVAKQYMWLALGKLSIFPCEECGGTGKSKSQNYPADCLDCHGHGWAIEEVSDE